MSTTSIFVYLTSADGANGQGPLMGEMEWDAEPQLQTESAHFEVLRDGNVVESFLATGDQWRDFESNGLQEALVRRVEAGQSVTDFFENRSVDIEIYDNGGETFDRYTVIYLDEIERLTPDGYLFGCRGMSEHPNHPQGYGQYSSAQSGPHLGRRICFVDLPPDCRVQVARDLGFGSEGIDAARKLYDSEFAGSYASLLDSGAPDAPLHSNPFAAVYAVANENGLGEALKDAILSVVTWENFDPSDLSDDLLSEIYRATDIAVQYNQDGTYQAFLSPQIETQERPSP